MTSVEKSRSCCICKKVFCCVQCRERHEESKHPNRQLNCPLCKSHKLPLQAFEDKSLFCHIVIAHLPLYCYLCGETFKKSKDLESFDTCKWWKSQHRHSLVSDSKSTFSTPPLTLEGKDSPLANEYNGNFDSLTSPPTLYRNTSTPMVVGQKSTFDFKTPSAPNFSLKTPKTNSVSLKTDQTCSGFQESSGSNYASFPSSTNQGETPFRSLSLNCLSKDLPKGTSKKLDVMKEQDQPNLSEQEDNNEVEDMELTGVESGVLPESQSLEIGVQKGRRSDSLKKVRFSDQYDNISEPSTAAGFNMTENEEYFEACDTLSEMRENLENSQIKIYEENVKNAEKERNSPDRPTINISQQSSSQSSSSSRVLMMVLVENNSNVTTSELIDSGLKKLGHLASGINLSANNHSSPGSSNSVSTTVNNYYSFSTQESYSPPNQVISSIRRDSNSSSNSSDSSGSGGFLSAFANAVKSVMRNFSGVGTSRNIEREHVSSRSDIVPGPSTSDTFSPMSSFASSLLRRPGKRSRDTLETISSPQRQPDYVVPQVEMRSPLAKRHRGWYKIKGREPIARMRNRLTSPRGVSSETQVFRQGSLSVGDTVLPLPSRAHQSTQTE
ncbi:uncharacterized protein LOC143180931 [Calliopsis andreniformis]|uniref:uncharacterized protein LOC143180931 n=1 Tax=Calliopsis andreniformis TaxID=337506 RepID=UPI003FCE34B0